MTNRFILFCITWFLALFFIAFQLVSTVVASAEEVVYQFSTWPTVSIKLPSCPHFEWKNQEEYKNIRLREFQEMLCERGIRDPYQVKMFTAQLAQENGTLTADRMGDWECTSGKRGKLKGGHCSFGIIQLNTWSSHGISAEEFYPKHPEYHDYKFQLAWMADAAKNRLDKWDNLRIAIIDHNCPACAAAGVDSKAGYFKDITARSAEIIPI